MIGALRDCAGGLRLLDRKLEHHAPPMRTLLAGLTRAETDVVLWICRGCSDDKELGRTLHRSPHTIRTHVSNIVRKLNLRSRQELVRWVRLRQP